MSGCPANGQQEPNTLVDPVLGKSYFANGYIISETQTLPGYFEKAAIESESDIPNLEVYYATGDFTNLDANNHLNSAWVKIEQNRIPASDCRGHPFIQFAVKEKDFSLFKKLTWKFESAFSDHFKHNSVARETWQARLPKKDISNWVEDWNNFAVHHTAGSALSSQKTVQNIQNFHMDTRQWSDIAYHFLLGNDGKVFEGRSFLFQGADVKGHNTYTVGITALGCFDEKECDGVKNPMVSKMTTPLLNAFGELVGLLAYRENITDINISNVKGHLQFLGAKTACPGNIIINYIDDIIAIAKQTVKQLKLMAA